MEKAKQQPRGSLCSSNSQSSSSPAFQFGEVPGRRTVSKIYVPVGWLSLPGMETWWQWRQVSLHPANGVINNKKRWVGGERKRERGRVGGGLSRNSTCISRWAAGADRAAERQDMVWRSRNLWFDISSVWESVRGQEKVFEGAAATSSYVQISGFFFLSKTSDWGRRVSEQHGTHRRWSALNGRRLDVIQPAVTRPRLHK